MAAQLSAVLTRQRRQHRLVLATPILLGLGVVLLWELVARTGAVSPFFLPAPSRIVARLFADVSSTMLLRPAAITLIEAMLGSLLGTVIAFPLGYIIARNRWAAAGLQPYVAASQAMPAVALAPLLVIWVGYGLLPIVLLCALLVFFPILLGTMLGLRTIDPDFLDAARLDGAFGWRLLWHIEVPLALPSLLTGLRNGFTLSITGAVVGEFVMGGTGLGMIVSVQGNSADTTGLFASLLVLALLAVGMYSLLRAVERVLSTERPTVRSRFAPLLPAADLSRPKEPR